ncbi:50S ribosomal protein L23 [Candidatus Peregrinibacteria bacterium CG10_big_fil_rev_8_21_14_0_10_49_10]|nr:MAG: 50S ribosomal protein L23 [Candidatus Peregrinibacteria bacterium CG10_big_fil_rev_8_21_14_0_10_49_10]
MDLSRVILGPVVTEKAEGQKLSVKTYWLRVSPRASKVDVKAALKRVYDVDAASVRMLRVGGKVRAIGRTRTMQKRHPYKRAIVTLTAKSKALDLTSFV